MKSLHVFHSPRDAFANSRKARAVAFSAFAALAVCSITPNAFAQETPHVHGVAELEVSVEAGTLAIRMDAPLDNLVGFERAPRTNAERQLAQRVIAQLRAGGELFRIDPKGGCVLTKVELGSAALGLQPAEAHEPAHEQADEPGHAHGGHADLQGIFEFDCKAAEQARFIELGLFGAFKGMRQLKVQIATTKGQYKRTLDRPATRLSWDK